MSVTPVIHVALLGFGTVGSALASRLFSANSANPANNASHLSSSCVLTHIFDRSAARKREVFDPHGKIVWTTSIDDVLCGNADIVVEAIGGVDPAADWIRQALLHGKSVVTANKQVVARHGAELWALAARQGRQFRFEAAVGGAMPVVRAVSDGLAGDRVTRIVAILNGTTNAVLSRMDADGVTLSQALDEARERGFAEVDSSADLDGADARAKLAILSALAFGVRVRAEDIPVRTASAITQADLVRARRAGATIRQIAHAEYDRERSSLAAWVAPVEVPRDSVFGRTIGARNVAVITGEYAGDIVIAGAGAGGGPTAVAILSDIAAIARDRAAVVPPPRLTSEFSVRNPIVFGLSEMSTSILAEAV
jgi:homoserine dehydrogenase